MDDLSTLGPLALGLLAWALGLAALMTRRTGLCAPQSGVLRRRSVPGASPCLPGGGGGRLVRHSGYSARLRPQRRRSGSWNPGAQRRGMAPYQI